MKTEYYQAHIVVDRETREDIENITKGSKCITKQNNSGTLREGNKSQHQGQEGLQK